MLGRTPVLPLAAALDRLRKALDDIAPIGDELISLEESLGRVTAKPVMAPCDLPPHPRSTMDGYAVQAADTFGAAEGRPVYLTVSGEVLMGEMVYSGPAGQECYAIATGGFLPPRTDAVIMLEHTVAVDSLIEVIKAVSPGSNILAAGDDLHKDSLVLPPGKTLRPQELGLLAGSGITAVAVYKQVKVGIFSTGDEIVDFRQSPPPGKIRDMNGVNLAALTRQSRAIPRYYGIVADRETSFTETLQQALDENDLVLFSGSSSVGTRDLGEAILNKLAAPGVIIHGVAIKPGKPVIIALADKKPIFGLPGHPVSAAVAFDLFARPAIAHLGGIKASDRPDRRTVPAKLARNLNSAPGRTDFIRVRLTREPGQQSFTAHPVLGKSGALSTMVQADGYIIIPESSQGLYESDLVEVLLFE